MTNPVSFGLNRVTVSAFLGTPIQDIKVARLFLVARTERGQVNTAIICKDDQDFLREFGAGTGNVEFENTYNLILDYFKEVGNLSDLVVLRVYEGDADAGKAIEPTGASTPRLRVRAGSPGTHGNNIQRNVFQTSAGVYTLVVREVVAGLVRFQRIIQGITANADKVEAANRQLQGFAELTLNPAGTVDFLSIAVSATAPSWVNLAGGANSAAITDATLMGGINASTQERSGLQVLNLSGLGGGVLVGPHLNTSSQREIMATFCQETARFYPQAPSSALLPPDAQAEFDTLSTLTGASYSAYYYPLLREIQNNVTVHRSNLGAVAGRIVRAVMQQSGNVDAPNGEILSARDIQRSPNGKDYLVHDQNLALLTDYGINCLYASGNGITIQGLKLLSPDPLNTATTEVHHRLLLNALVYDIGPGLSQFSYAKLDGRGFLIEKIKSFVRDKLMRYYQNGCLYGASPDEAFSVTINAIQAAQTAEKTGRIEVKVNVKISPVLKGVDVAIFHVPLSAKV